MTNQDVDADLKAKAAAATLQAMGYTIERLSAENESLIAGIEQSRRTSDYWKAEHLAGNAETESLRTQLDQCNDALAEIKALESELEQSRADASDKIIQVSGFGVNNTSSTQCDYMLVGLTESGRVVMSDGGRAWCDVSPLPSTPSKEQNAND